MLQLVLVLQVLRLLMKGVIKIESLDARFETIERSLADWVTIDVLTQIHPQNMIVISRLSPEQVYSQQTAVEAQVKLLFISVVIPEINVLQVERITQKHPSPAQIRPQTVRRIRREGNALSFAVSERIFLVGIGVLQHHRIIVMLVFDISRIRTVEFSEEPGEHMVESTGSPALAEVQAREQINPTIQKHLFITYALILMMIL